MRKPSLSALAFLATLTAAAPVDAAPPPRNVILITLDTLRADVLGAYGGPAHTPVLDGLAASGWLFEECISAAMLTNPSHASIMTSLYPRDHGVYDNESGIHDGLRTLAGELQRRGMRTGAVINFPHLNPNVANLGQGFARIVPAGRDERRATEISRLGLQLIDDVRLDLPAAGPGFFVWLHYTDPHAPYDPPAAHPPRPYPQAVQLAMSRAQRVAPGFQRNNPWFRAAFKRFAKTEALSERYLAEVEATDSGLGQLLAGLARRGLTGETALVVTSDHGENLGEHDLFFHHGGLYRESVHVPLVVVSPGVAPRRVRQQVATVDIAPTVLDLLGVAPWEPMRGTTLAPVARGERPGREFVFSEHMLAQQVAVRSAEGTLILHRKSSRQFPSYRFVAGKRELYVRRDDPRERHPQAATGDLAQRLEAALQRYLGLGLQLTARDATDQDRESLRALGYVE